MLLHFEYTNHRIIEKMNPNHPDNNNCEGDLERDAEGELINILNHPRYKNIIDCEIICYYTEFEYILNL